MKFPKEHSIINITMKIYCVSCCSQNCIYPVNFKPGESTDQNTWRRIIKNIQICLLKYQTFNKGGFD